MSATVGFNLQIIHDTNFVLQFNFILYTKCLFYVVGLHEQQKSVKQNLIDNSYVLSVLKNSTQSALEEFFFACSDNLSLVWYLSLT